MPDHDLEDPNYAAFAWGRFKRLMIWMVAASSVSAVVGLWGLSRMIGPIPIHMAIATGIGVFVTVLLAATLMGLVFLSAGSGHDEKIRDPYEDDMQ
jgi:hypothetical protein